MTTDDLPYQAGYGNALQTEALPGTLPRVQNTPHDVAHGLVTEQLNGTGFTVPRGQNHRVWMYRLRPQVLATPWERLQRGRFTTHLADGVSSPEILRYQPLAYAAQVDFLDGLVTFAAGGDPLAKRGMAVHLYATTADMVDRAFTSVDGDLVVIPQEGRLRVRTELGLLEVAPGEIAVLPRGLRFSVSLPDGRSRGFVGEVYDRLPELPNRGLTGANGLADERHFLAPVAAFEDREVPHEIVVKQGGDLWRNTAPFSPFDVVAWHGSYAPFKYDLMKFNAMGSVTFDHPDPSIFTVLTVPSDDHGRNAFDLGVFRGRWDVAENTFRPPYFHRNSAIEFNAVLKTTRDEGPFRPGAFTFTPYLTPHGISARGQHAELDRTDPSPKRLPNDSLWIQFESTYLLTVALWMLDHPQRDGAYLDSFAGYRNAELPR